MSQHVCKCFTCKVCIWAIKENNNCDKLKRSTNGENEQTLLYLILTAGFGENGDVSIFG